MSVSDPLSQTFDNSRLTYAWITDEHRVILRFTGKNPDYIPDLASRPMTGSSFCSLARSTRSYPYLFSVS